MPFEMQIYKSLFYRVVFLIDIIFYTDICSNCYSTPIRMSSFYFLIIVSQDFFCGFTTNGNDFAFGLKKSYLCTGLVSFKDWNYVSN
jgi:hypothetical protein